MITVRPAIGFEDGVAGDELAERDHETKSSFSQRLSTFKGSKSKGCFCDCKSKEASA